VRIRTGLPDSSLVARRICDIQRVVCAAPAYLKAHGTPKTPDDLKNHNCLINTLSPAPFDWDFQTPQGRRVIKVRGTAQANNANVLLTSLLEGIGIARLPVFIVGPDLAAKRLVPILSGFPTEAHQLYVVYPQNRHQSPKVRVFIDLLLARFGHDQPWERCPDPE
jgi:DNA-binding transcriptional LysR family regulator